MPEFTSTPGPYTGPVPLSTHLHGAHVGDESDGFPEAWYLPAATNIPSGYAKEGTHWGSFSTKFDNLYGGAWQPGSAVARYPNDQAATTLWFHDHTLGMTRANVYSGLQGFSLIRGGPFDLLTLSESPMTDITYNIVEHDGGWAYKVGDTFSETFASHDAALAAAKRAAGEQTLPGEDVGITYEDKNAVWHGEVADGDDRPTTHVRDSQ